MLDYNAYVLEVIARGGYVLADMEERIDRLWLDGKLTQAEHDELLQIAAENAPESEQINIVEKLAEIEHRLYSLEHPTDIYAIWTSGYQTQQHEIVRYDVTGDGEYDLCQYNGGRSYTALSIGKIEGWHLLNIELERTHTITRDSAGNFVLTPIESE